MAESGSGSRRSRYLLRGAMNVHVEFASNQIDLKSEPQFHVGGTTVDPASREATLKGGAERLQPQVLKVLIALVRRRNQLVTREQIIEQCWDGRFIGDDVINRAISTLRQFSQRAGGFTIETVPRAGYRLIDETPRRQRLSSRWIILTVTSIAMVGTILILEFEWNRAGPADAAVSVAPAEPPPVPAPPPPPPPPPLPVEVR